MSERPRKAGWWQGKNPFGNTKESMEKDVLKGGFTKFLEEDAKVNGRSALLVWLQDAEVVEAVKTSNTTARATYRFPVDRTYLNPAGTLQGGMATSMFDTGTSIMLHLIRRKDFWWYYGTTRTLNVTYLRPAAEGEVLLMECEIVHAGKAMCLITAKLLRESDRALICTCEHQKFNIDPPPAKL